MLNHPFFRFFLTPRHAFFFMLAAALVALAAAMVAQFGFDMKPCILCLWQRAPYALVLILSLLGLLAAQNNEKAIRILLVLLALCFLVGAALAFTHVGVEQKWWSLGGGCPVMSLEGRDTAAALAALLTTPQADCSVVAWRFLGQSITVWNLVLSLVLFDYATLTLFFSGQRKTS